MADSAPRNRLSPDTPAMMVSENRIRVKNSGGPKLSAKDASHPAKTISARFDIKSAVQEAQSAMPSARPASPGHWVAIKNGGRRRRRAGCLDQDRGNTPAENPALVDAQQQQNPGDRLHGEGKRQGQGHRHGGRHPRDGPADHTDHHPPGQRQKRLDIGDQRKPRHKTVDKAHGSLTTSPCGIATPATCAKKAYRTKGMITAQITAAKGWRVLTRNAVIAKHNIEVQTMPKRGSRYIVATMITAIPSRRSHAPIPS